LVDNRLPEIDVQSVRLEMWREMCRSGGSLSFKILSGSMRPTLEVGDIVKVSGVEPSDVHVGDILAFRVGQNAVIHRIIGKSRFDRQLIFRHRGDAGGLPATIEEKNIIGKVLSINRNGLEIPLDTLRVTFSNKILGWRLHFIDTIDRMPPGLKRTVIHQTLRLPWRLCRSIFKRIITGKKK
jgi:signal peptidase I